MARKEARIFTNIWDDEDFVAAHELEQRGYLFLVSQPDLEHSGVLPLRRSRWARKGPSLSGEDWDKLLISMERRKFVVVDWDTEEVLVRSLIRRDMVFKEPNVMRSAIKHVSTIESKTILLALAAEMCRIRVEFPSLTKGQEDALSEMESALAERVGPHPPSLDRNPTDDPPSNPSPKGSANPSDSPSAMGSWGRGSVTEVSTDSPSPVPPAVPLPAGGASRPTGNEVALFEAPEAPPPPPNAGQLVAYWLERCRQRPPERVIGQMSKEIKRLVEDGIDAAHIEAGIDDWITKDLSPSNLPTLVNSAMNRKPSASRASPHQGQIATTDRKILAGQQLAAQLRALEGGQR